MEIVLDEHTRIKKETRSLIEGPEIDVWSLIWKGKDRGYLHNLAGERTRVNLNENVHLTREGDTWTLWWTTPSNEVLSFVVTAENIRAAGTRFKIASETTVKKIGGAWYLTWKDVGGETAVPLLGIKNDWPALCDAKHRLPKLDRELADVTKQRDDFRVLFEQANDMLRGKTTRWLGTEHSLYQKNGEWYLRWDKNRLTYHVDIRMLSNHFVDHKKCAELEKELVEERKKLDEANKLLQGTEERQIGLEHFLYHNGSGWAVRWMEDGVQVRARIDDMARVWSQERTAAREKEKLEAKLKTMEHTVELSKEYTVRKHGPWWRLHYQHEGKEENVMFQTLVDLWHAKKVKDQTIYDLRMENTKLKEQLEILKKDNKALEDEKDEANKKLAKTTEGAEPFRVSVELHYHPMQGTWAPHITSTETLHPKKNEQ